MTGRIALITGASRGLGRSIALHLARGGTHVIGTYLNRRADADAVVAEIEAAGGTAVMLPLDVGDSAAFPAFAATIGEVLRTSFGREQFDVLVNNAGAGVHAPFAATTEAQFDEHVPHPRQGAVLPDAGAAAAARRRRPDPERVDRAGAFHDARLRGLRLGQGRRRGADPLHGEGAGRARHPRQRRRARRDRVGLRRRASSATTRI